MWGVWISDGSGNRVGSSSTGAGNIIAGNYRGVYITGAAIGNVIAGNQIGWSAAYSGDVNAQAEGVWLRGGQQNIVGGSASGSGNLVGGTVVGVNDDGTADLVQANWIGIMPDGKTAIPPVAYGIAAGVAHSAQISQNTIANVTSVGMQLQSSPSSHVFGNQITASGEHGIALNGDCSGTVITLNSIFRNGDPTHPFEPGNGIYVANDKGITISQNRIYDNAGLGIGFQRNGTPVLDGLGAQLVQILFSRPPPLLANGQLQITGILETGTAGGTYLLEFFGNDHGNRSGYGEGQRFLGSTTVTVSLLGSGAINVTLPVPSDPGEYLTATATAPDGSTSEFSKAILIQPCLPGIKGICPGIEANVPSLPSGTVPKSHGHHPLGGGLASGDGNGDGIQDSLQSNVASLPSLSGMWVTLAGLSGTTLENVTSAATPDYSSLPAGYIFPIGFLSFGITNLPGDGAITITNFLHRGSVTNLTPPYAATTYFNYGPTPDNATPHWYQFLFDGTNGAQLFPDGIILHFHDGALGDSDGSVNGEIVTVGAPAYQLAPAPSLSLSVTSVGSSNIVDYLADTNGVYSLVTNPVPIVTGVLSWPTSATNYVLKYLDNLSSPSSQVFDGLPTPLWQTLPQPPANVNGQNVLTNTTLSPSGFYRLF